jgi:hypothetical protein
MQVAGQTVHPRGGGVDDSLASDSYANHPLVGMAANGKNKITERRYGTRRILLKGRLQLSPYTD